MKSIHTYRFICALISLGVLFLLVEPFSLRIGTHDTIASVDVETVPEDTITAVETVLKDTIAVVVEPVPEDTYITETEHSENLKVLPLDVYSTIEPEDEESDIEVSANVENTPKEYYTMTDEEIRDFAALLWLEARGEPEDVKYAVASVILNRVTLYEMSLHDVMYAPGQFSPAKYIENTDPTEDEIRIVKDVLQTGPTIPEYVCYFRAGHYHSWSGMNDYGYFGGGTYFSYSDSDFIIFCNR